MRHVKTLSSQPIATTRSEHDHVLLEKYSPRGQINLAPYRPLPGEARDEVTRVRSISGQAACARLLGEPVPLNSDVLVRGQRRAVMQSELSRSRPCERRELVEPEGRQSQLPDDARGIDYVLHPSLEPARDQLGDQESLRTGAQTVGVDVLDPLVARSDAG